MDNNLLNSFPTDIYSLNDIFKPSDEYEKKLNDFIELNKPNNIEIKTWEKVKFHKPVSSPSIYHFPLIEKKELK